MKLFSLQSRAQGAQYACTVSLFPDTSLCQWMAYTRRCTYPSVFAFVARQILIFITLLYAKLMKKWKRLSIHRETKKEPSASFFFFLVYRNAWSVSRLYYVRTYMHKS
ncbi:hypothetical protein H4582DRAFT_1318379 [Lactarius indigo]|nr:hypothetical protein H4582DRAFT_1318379 [Lactarius indigo]